MVKKEVIDWGNFTPVADNVLYRLIWRSFGAEKTGKNHLCYTAPGPIAVQSFDIGLEGMVEKFVRKGKKIFRSEYEFDKDNCEQGDAQALRDLFIEDFERALKKARTIQWDTETEIWELFRFAEFGEASDAPKNYVKLNATYRDLIQKAYDTGVNLQLIQKVKEKWGSYESTDRNGKRVLKPINLGVMEPTGFKEAGYIVQANFEHTWEKERGFVLRVLNCRQNMGIAGEELENVEFPELAQMIFPESDESNWEDS